MPSGSATPMTPAASGPPRGTAEPTDQDPGSTSRRTGHEERRHQGASAPDQAGQPGAPAPGQARRSGGSRWPAAGRRAGPRPRTSPRPCRPFSAAGSRARIHRPLTRAQANRRGRRRQAPPGSAEAGRPADAGSSPVRAEATIQPRARSNVGKPTEPDTGAAGHPGQLDWLLDDLVRRVGPIGKAVSCLRTASR